LKEGYTFKQLLDQQSLNSIVTGRKAQEGFAWVEQLRLKGYTNHYYGNLIFDKGMGWHSAKAINSEDQILDEVLSAFRQLKSERWSITVGLTNSNANTEYHHHSKNATAYEICSRYFKDGPEFNHAIGVSCQRSMKWDAMIGEVLQTLRSTEVWEDTIVILVLAGEQNVFSISGGALPAKFFGRTNGDIHSLLDVVPTILSVAGFSDSQLRLAKLGGVSVISLNHSTSGSF